MKLIHAETCIDAWVQGCDHLLGRPGWRDYNLILEIASPLALPPSNRKVHDLVNGFLVDHDGMPISTVINTIFPAQLYRRYGTNGVYQRYKTDVYPKIKKLRECSWGTYAHRFTDRTDHNGKNINPLRDLIAKMAGQAERMGPIQAEYELGVLDPGFEIPIYDPGHDRNRPIGGPCLSHVSFKLDSDKRVRLTALYRSHFYVQRTLGNLLGLAHLQNFVAEQTKLKIGPLTCISTMGILDLKSGHWGKNDVRDLISACTQLVRPSLA